jgi:hypothetical protein
MSRQNSVTTQLKKSIEKVTGYIFQARVYSDVRKKGAAVGVKVCYTEYSQPIIDQIVADMESKGFKFAYSRYNYTNRTPGYWSTIPGTRFTFYKKSE